MSSFLLRRALPRALPVRAFSTSSRANSFAKMTIIGRLADQPELQATSTGTEILRYAVGTSSGPKDNQKTSWFRVTSFLPEAPREILLQAWRRGTFFAHLFLLASTEGRGRRNRFSAKLY